MLCVERRVYRYATGLIMLLLASLLTACGFHLRGEVTLPSSLQPITVESSHAYQPFIQRLRYELTSYGVKIAPSLRHNEAETTLIVDQIQFNRSLDHVSSNTLTKIYQLTYRVKFRLEDSQQQTVYGPETVTTTTTYSLNQNQILSDTQQLEQHKQALMERAVRELLARLNSEQVKQALTHR